LQVGRVDHHRLRGGSLRGQTVHHPSEDTLVTPPLPAIVEGLGRAIFLRRIAPTQAIAIDEDYAAQNPPVIAARLAMALAKEGLQPRRLRVRHPEELGHRSVS